jgi:hypothetical protein
MRGFRYRCQVGAPVIKVYELCHHGGYFCEYGCSIPCAFFTENKEIKRDKNHKIKKCNGNETGP